MKRVLVAGATGYLGQCLVKELKCRGFWVRVLIRNEKQKTLFKNVDDCFIGEVTKPKTIKGIAKNIHWVFSTIGITRQKDGLTYMDVDYQGNSNLLKEALAEDVERFQYISAINGNKLRHLKIFQAKEKFVDELKASGINYCVMRPNGFFSDMLDFLNMANGGRVYLFGDGNKQLNPIHGADLAKVCVDCLENNIKEKTVGGMDVLTHKQIAKLALKALNKPIKITYLPDCLRRFIIWFLRAFTSVKTYGPIEFFLTVMAYDNVATQYGTHSLEDFFKIEANKMKNKPLISN